MVTIDSSISTWNELVDCRLSSQGNKIAYIFLTNASETAALTYSQLIKRSRAIASFLQSRVPLGSRALLVYPPGLDYICAFYACLNAGIVAVPVAPPNHAACRETNSRLFKIARNALPSLILSTSAKISDWGKFLKPDLLGLSAEIVLTDQISESFSSNSVTPKLTASSIAFIQYTSGSVSSPKGVVITHKNLLANEKVIAEAFNHSEDSVVAGWLPFFHDMGLVGNLLQPFYCGGSAVLMAPHEFIQRPINWLNAISKFQATTSGGPNFAYNYCINRISPQECANLDLASWKIAFNGSEQVRAETLNRFCEKFTPYGFKRSAFRPCYGLAESTLMVTCSREVSEPRILPVQKSALSENLARIAESSLTPAERLVSCGTCSQDSHVVIVNPADLMLCGPGQIGEIWVSGPCVADGYFRNQEATDSSFNVQLSGKKQQFLRTGDLGFLLDNHLYVTGRLKELIILRGRNFYPHDIEYTVQQSHSFLRSGCGAAFCIESEEDEHLIIVQEVERIHRHKNLQPIVSAIREAVTLEHNIEVAAIVLVLPGTIPKTSSGKLKRGTCRQLYLEGELKPLLEVKLHFNEWQALLSQQLIASNLREVCIDERKSLIQNALAQAISKVKQIPAHQLSLDKGLAEYGFDSLSAAELVEQLNLDLSIDLRFSELLSMPSIQELANRIAIAVGDLTAKTVEEGTTPIPDSSTVPQQALSPQQMALWLLQQASPCHSLAYNVAFTLEIRGNLNIDALGKAISALVNRHEILRTNIQIIDGKPLANPQAFVPSILRVVDITNLSEEERQFEIKRIVQVSAQKPFCFEHEIFLRASLCITEIGAACLILVTHHIACDGWSVKVLRDDLVRLYDCFVNATSQPFPYPSMSYTQARTSRETVPNHSKAPGFQNINQSHDNHEEMQLPADFSSAPLTDLRSASYSIIISRAKLDAIQHLCVSEKTTLFNILLAVYKIVLAGWTALDKVIVASSSMSRRSSEERNIVGPFTSALVFKTDFTGNPSLRECIQRTRNVTLKAYDKQLSAADLQYHNGAKSPRSRQTHFAPSNVAFVFQDFLEPVSVGGGASFELKPCDTGLVNLDLLMTGYRHESGLKMNLLYRKALFKASTIKCIGDAVSRCLDHLISHPEMLLSEAVSMLSLESLRPSIPKRTIAISSTFTCEPIADSLEYWSQALSLNLNVRFAPFNQVFQQLLDPHSIFYQNYDGINLVLVRLTDWLPANTTVSHTGQETKLQEILREFSCAVNKSATTTGIPHIILFCPSRNDPLMQLPEASFTNYEQCTTHDLLKCPRVIVIGSAQILGFHGPGTIYDSYSDQNGVIPYTSAFFTSLGTMAARSTYSLLTARPKVIVVDCDNTIWKGTIGEDGIEGIQISSIHRDFQEFLLQQEASGMMICLCSKNQEQDVLEVFQKHSNMILNIEKVSRWKINWEPKSTNIKALARELNLGLESFVFIDDNPLECAEVRAHCPEVLVLEFQSNREEETGFLSKIWPLDIRKATEEDKKRTQFYKGDVIRKQFIQMSRDYEDFFTRLELHVDIQPIQEGDLDRVSQLTFRTSQFNSCPRHFTPPQLRTAMSEGKLLVVHVTDRFGDYGLVGVMGYRVSRDCLQVHTFLLSCRALGKGIEYEMIYELGNEATARGCEEIEIFYSPTKRNEPIIHFFQSICIQLGIVHSGGNFRFRTNQASLVKRSSREFSSLQETETEPRLESSSRLSAHNFHVPLWLMKLPELHEKVQSATRPQICTTETYVAPRTPIETELHDIWTRFLSVRRISVEANFFELGGQSLLGVMMLSEISLNFGVEIQLQTLLANPTIETLSRIIEGILIEQFDSSEHEIALREISNLHDDEVNKALKAQLTTIPPCSESHKDV